MPTFPSTLPAPLIDGYALQPQDVRVRSSMDGGIARLRRRFTAPPVHQVAVQWRLTQEEFGLIDAWLNTYASDWFTIALTGPSGNEAVAARLIGQYQAAPAGAPARWTISATLEVRDFFVLGAEYVDALTTYDDLVATGSGLHPWTAGLKTSEYYP